MCITYVRTVGRDSSIGIATRYGLDGPGIESRWCRYFPHPSRLALGPTQPPVQWVPGLSRGLSGRGVALTTHPHYFNQINWIFFNISYDLFSQDLNVGGLVVSTSNHQRAFELLCCTTTCFDLESEHCCLFSQRWICFAVIDPVLSNGWYSVCSVTTGIYYKGITL